MTPLSLPATPLTYSNEADGRWEDEDAGESVLSAWILGGWLAPWLWQNRLSLWSAQPEHASPGTFYELGADEMRVVRDALASATWTHATRPAPTNRPRSPSAVRWYRDEDDACRGGLALCFDYCLVTVDVWVHEGREAVDAAGVPILRASCMPRVERDTHPHERAYTVHVGITSADKCTANYELLTEAYCSGDRIRPLGGRGVIDLVITGQVSPCRPGAYLVDESGARVPMASKVTVSLVGARVSSSVALDLKDAWLKVPSTTDTVRFDMKHGHLRSRTQHHRETRTDVHVDIHYSRGGSVVDAAGMTVW